MNRIKEKLKLIKEGFSLVDINESFDDYDSIFLESIYDDINNIDGAFDYLIEADVKKTRNKGLSGFVQWLLRKIEQLILFLKNEIRQTKDMTSKIKSKSPKQSTKFYMYDKVFQGKDRIREVLDKSRKLISSDNMDKFNGKKRNEMQDIMFKQILGNSYKLDDINDIKIQILGNLRVYELSDNSYYDKLVKLLEESKNYEQELLAIAETLKIKSQSLVVDNIFKYYKNAKEYLNRINYYVAFSHILTRLIAVVTANAKVISQALNKVLKDNE